MLCHITFVAYSRCLHYSLAQPHNENKTYTSIEARITVFTFHFSSTWAVSLCVSSCGITPELSNEMRVFETLCVFFWSHGYSATVQRKQSFPINRWFNVILIHLACVLYAYPQLVGPPLLSHSLFVSLIYLFVFVFIFVFYFVVVQLFRSIPVGIGQVYGCDNPWTGGIFIIALFISSPITCVHATIGSAVGMVSGEA